jgi:hypothetical protein
MDMTTILDDAPVASIDGAIELMQAIDAALPDRDGVKWFNRLYLRVTENVGTAVAHAHFEDPAFLATLDVVFANLYFEALHAALDTAHAAPSAWRPLLEQRRHAGISRIQFALAGMSAHINRDLPEGIVRAFRLAGGDPTAGAARRRDFDSINDLLERVEQDVKTEFTHGLVGLVDEVGGPVDDAIAMWQVRKARSAAWTNAEVLWTLGAVPRLRDRFFRRLDGLVGLTARGLLVPRLSGLRSGHGAGPAL